MTLTIKIDEHSISSYKANVIEERINKAVSLLLK